MHPPRRRLRRRQLAVGGDHRYQWSRKPVEIAFAQGRIAVKAHVDASVEAMGTTMEFPIELDIAAEPVVSSDYRARACRHVYKRNKAGFPTSGQVSAALRGLSCGPTNV